MKTLLNLLYIGAAIGAVFYHNNSLILITILASILFLILIKLNIYRKLFFVFMIFSFGYLLLVNIDTSFLSIKPSKQKISDKKEAVQGSDKEVTNPNTSVSTTTANLLIGYREQADAIVLNVFNRIANKETLSPEEVRLNFDNAMKFADQSIATADIPFSNITKGRVYESFATFAATSDIKLQFLGSALMQYQKAATQDDSDPESHATLARLYAIMPNQKEKAVLEITKAIQLSTNIEQIKLYTKLLDTLTK